MQNRFYRGGAARRLCQIALVGYWLVLVIATHIPSETVPLPGDGIDKAVHFVAFAVLSLLVAAVWLGRSRPISAWQLFVIWAGVVIFAALDEWTQDFVGRYTSLADWVADAIGAAIGLALFALFRVVVRSNGADDATEERSR